MLKTLSIAAVATALLFGAMPAQAGMKLNGLRSNGIGGNGMHINGMTINGMTINGMTINGMRMNGTDAGAAQALRVIGVELPATPN